MQKSSNPIWLTSMHSLYNPNPGDAHLCHKLPLEVKVPDRVSSLPFNFIAPFTSFKLKASLSNLLK